MRHVYRLMTTLLALGLLASCDESGKIRVDRVEPLEGISAGGDHVNIIGAGFQPGKTQARIMFGKHLCEQVVISSTNKISVDHAQWRQGAGRCHARFRQRHPLQDSERLPLRRAQADRGHAQSLLQQARRKEIVAHGAQPSLRPLSFSRHTVGQSPAAPHGLTAPPYL